MELVPEEIAILPGTKIDDIKVHFSALYPFLTIEFLQKPGPLFVAASGHSSAFSLKDLTDVPKTALLNIKGSRTVSEVTKDCMNELGVRVQIFRKSGKVWNIISITDQWTLERQNNAGRFISAEMTRDHDTA